MTRQEDQERLIKLIEPLIEAHGFELVLLEYIAGKHGKLHLYIDHENGISIENCTFISKTVSDLLDLEDPIAHAYTLEVSSPGLERPLTKKEHFMRYQGHKVKTTYSDKPGESIKLSGTLQGAEPDRMVIKKEDGTKVEVPYDLIIKANLWYTKPEKDQVLKLKRKEAEEKSNE